MTGQEKKNAKVTTTGERLRELNRLKQAHLYKTCVKQNTQESTSAREFLSLNPKVFGALVRDIPNENSVTCRNNQEMSAKKV